MKLKAIVAKVRRMIVMRQLRAVDARQREAVSDALFAGDMRIHAYSEYARRSTVNAARKRQLLEKLDSLNSLLKQP